jgi:hypothetical protein
METRYENGVTKAVHKVNARADLDYTSAAVYGNVVHALLDRVAMQTLSNIGTNTNKTNKLLEELISVLRNNAVVSPSKLEEVKQVEQTKLEVKPQEVKPLAAEQAKTTEVKQLEVKYNDGPQTNTNRLSKVLDKYADLVSSLTIKTFECTDSDIICMLTTTAFDQKTIEQFCEEYFDMPIVDSNEASSYVLGFIYRHNLGVEIPVNKEIYETYIVPLMSRLVGDINSAGALEKDLTTLVMKSSIITTGSNKSNVLISYRRNRYNPEFNAQVIEFFKKHFKVTELNYNCTILPAGKYTNNEHYIELTVEKVIFIAACVELLKDDKDALASLLLRIA